MAESPNDQKSRYPLMAYNFKVSIQGSTMGFSEVSGLKREYETVTYRHGLSFVEGEVLVRFRVDKYETITLKRGTLRGGNALYDWLEAGDERSVTVSLCDEGGSPVVSWFIAKAVPIKLDASSFSATSTEVFIETLELMARGVKLEA